MITLVTNISVYSVNASIQIKTISWPKSNQQIHNTKNNAIMHANMHWLQVSRNETNSDVPLDAVHSTTSRIKKQLIFRTN